MSIPPLIGKRGAALFAVALALFAAFFHVLHKQRRELKPLQEGTMRIHRLSLLPRAYAQRHEQMWPAPDMKTRAFALPLESMPPGYWLASQFKREAMASVDALLLGVINYAGAYSLKSVEEVASNYFYFGYAVSNEKEFQALVNAVRSGAALENTIEVGPGNGTLGSSKLYRLRDDLLNVLVADGVIEEPDPFILEKFPTLVEQPKNGKGWVMYMSAKIEQVSYPSAFPMLESVVGAIDVGLTSNPADTVTP